MRFVFLAVLGLIGGCASDPAVRQQLAGAVQARCLAESKKYIEAGVEKDYFTRCVDSRLSALGEEPIYDPGFEERWPEFENPTTGRALQER
ncbi:MULTISPECIES: hypothetical protein [Methylocaldum]|jgi:hypothetical protein|uniref:hypothetical protein n=1 Tax=unclassified Methylocaldum TaxID=2622260 RepID=UPI00098B5029|nr:hypothetical protein [Methylocaldum sp. 14B]MVF21782.1 hypothetical protein [Methylocaldum sp. BRCS4]